MTQTKRASDCWAVGRAGSVIVRLAAQGFDLAPMGFLGQATLLGAARGSGGLTRLRHMGGRQHQFTQALERVLQIALLSAMALGFDHHHAVAGDAAVATGQQLGLDGFGQGRGDDIEAEVNGARDLVDVLTAGALGADGVGLNFMVRDDNSRGDDEHGRQCTTLAFRSRCTDTATLNRNLRSPAHAMASTLFDLTGKVALVTGSTKGIGRAIATELARHGAKVVISSRKAPACEEVAASINAELPNGPGGAVSIPANISTKAELEKLVAATHAQLGKIDVLVCNAAVNPFYGSMRDLPDEAFQKILGVNIMANHWLVNLVLPEMIERKDGSIIVVSSIGGLRGHDTLGAYCISKAADLQLVRNLAVEHGQHNVRVNAISPGLIRTDFARALWENPVLLAERTINDPLRRIGEPDEIAGIAVYLASRASSFTTGQNFVIDGGSTI